MSGLSPYGTASTQVPAFNYSKDGMFTSKTYHGLSILVNGNVIGRIQSWAPDARTRTAVHKWELSANAFGRPVDLIPSKADGYSISVGRIDVWEQELEVVCGYGEGTAWTDLIDQNYPFVFSEQLWKGGWNTTLYRSWDYPSCWFTSYAEQSSEAEGDGAYLITAQIMHMPRIRTN